MNNDNISQIIFNKCKALNLIVDKEDGKVLRKLLEVYCYNNTTRNYLILIYTKHILTNNIRKNVTKWLSIALYNDNNSNYKFTNVIAGYISNKYNIEKYDVLDRLASTDMGDFFNDYFYVKSSLIALEQNTFDKYLEVFSQRINNYIKQYKIDNFMEEPIKNKKIENFFSKDPNDILLQIGNKKYYLYYILTKIDNKFYIIYVGSGDMRRITNNRNREFIRTYVESIPSSDKNIYIVPIKSYTLEYARHIEYKQITWFRKNGYALANIIGYNYIAGNLLTDLETQNKLLTKHKIAISDLYRYKIERIQFEKFKCVDGNFDNYLIK